MMTEKPLAKLLSRCDLSDRIPALLSSPFCMPSHPKTAEHSQNAYQLSACMSGASKCQVNAVRNQNPV